MQIDPRIVREPACEVRREAGLLEEAAPPGDDVDDVGRAEHGHSSDPAVQAFLMLRIGLTVFPILMGSTSSPTAHRRLDRYLAVEFNDIIPGSAANAMHVVGVVEIAAGLVVAVMPRFGGLLVGGWLAGIIVNLLLVGGYGDVAFRDFGLLLAALTLARLAFAQAGAADSAPD